MLNNTEVRKIGFNQKALILLCLSVAVTIGLASTFSLGSATLENKTLMQPQGTQGMSNTTNATNIVLVTWRMG